MLSVALAGAASADAPTGWEKGGEGLTTLDAVLIFVGIPLGLMVVIGLLASISSTKSTPRYRPNEKWENETEWFGAPADEPKALTDAASPPKPGGGASATW